MSAREHFFATCAPGLEPVLHAEMAALRLARVERQVGGVAFEGSLADAWRANLQSATAIRVLWRVATFRAGNADELRQGARAVDWRRFVRPDGSLAVKARASDAPLDNTMFAAQCVKDGIVDQLREATGARPSVDRDDPDLRVVAHLVGERARLLVDTSGESLHKRGWRRFQGRAPLAETTAAALLHLSGWDRRAPLLDPFCGSGTLLIEGALLASGTPPGIFRAAFAFERLPQHDAAAFAALKRELAARAALPRKLALWGGDRDPEAAAGAAENAAAAGFGERIAFERAEALEFAPRPGWNAQIVSNLPYGERVGAAADLAGTFRAFGTRLRERCQGYRAALLLPREAPGDGRRADLSAGRAAGRGADLGAALGWQGEERVALTNGGLDCELRIGSL